MSEPFTYVIILILGRRCIDDEDRQSIQPDIPVKNSCMNAVLHEFTSPGTQGEHWRKASLPRQFYYFVRTGYRSGKVRTSGPGMKMCSGSLCCVLTGTGSGCGYDSI